MLPYWILFAIPSWMAISSSHTQLKSHSRWPQYWVVVFILLVLMIGLRHEVGGDWGNYVDILEINQYNSFKDAISNKEPGYGLINWIGVQSGLGIYLVDTICAFLFVWGLVEFCLVQPRPWLALVVAVPYLIIVVAMGYSRQGVAIGIGMLALVALERQKHFHFAVLVVFAASFHTTALILLPLAALSSSRNKVWTVSWVTVLLIVAYVLFLSDTIDSYQLNYLEAEYQSAGAAIRVVMNAVPAVFFLLFRYRFTLSKADRVFWTWMSLIAVLFLVLLQVSTSSTAVDRMALYFIPLQLFVYSRLPDVSKKGNRTNVVIAIVVYSALVQFTWLFFAVHAAGWLPYQFYPLVWLLK